MRMGFGLLTFVSRKHLSLTLLDGNDVTDNGDDNDDYDDDEVELTAFVRFSLSDETQGRKEVSSTMFHFCTLHLTLFYLFDSRSINPAVYLYTSHSINLLMI